MAILEVKNVSKIYSTRFGSAKVQALSNMNFSVEEGEYVAIMGESGSGKTTLLNILASLDKPTGGEVLLKGRNLTAIREKELSAFRRDNLGFVFQDFNLLDNFSLRDNILLPLVLQGRAVAQMEQLIEPIAQRLGIAQLLAKYPYEVSGGQKQKFTIIMIMMQKAELTFYDEVTSGLDFETRQKLMEKMVEWYRDKEESLIIVSHYYEELEQLADKILLLDQGKVVAFGRTEELFKTYCGNAIFILDNNQVNGGLTKGFRTLKSPNHLIALSCRDREEERELLSILMDNNVNFKRSNSDIEIMSINAREQFYAKHEKQKN